MNERRSDAGRGRELLDRPATVDTALADDDAEVSGERCDEPVDFWIAAHSLIAQPKPYPAVIRRAK
jgi:hypothetical protein